MSVPGWGQTCQRHAIRAGRDLRCARPRRRRNWRDAARRSRRSALSTRRCISASASRRASRSRSWRSDRPRRPARARRRRAATYPSRLEAELKARLPGLPVTVLNKGIGGEEAPQMVARFEADVFEEAPDLVLWQVGSNSVLRDHPTPGEVIRQGVERLKDSRRRSDPDQSAIRAEDFGQARRRTVRRRHHGDRARRRGRAVRSLRRDALLVGDREDAVRPVHHGGRLAHERLGLCLRRQAARDRDPRRHQAAARDRAISRRRRLSSVVVQLRKPLSLPDPALHLIERGEQVLAQIVRVLEPA